MSDTAVLERTETTIKLGDNWKVLFHNDSVTTVEFVIVLLITIFGKGQSEAVELTYKIHEEGKAIVAEYSNHDIAEQKVFEANKFSEAYGYPLRITIEQ